jgi:hypothetical protein
MTLNKVYICSLCLFFFFYNSGCPGQSTRTTTNPRAHWTPCKPSRQVRYRGSDKYARWGLNSGCRSRKTLSPLGYKHRCALSFSLALWCLGAWSFFEHHNDWISLLTAMDLLGFSDMFHFFMNALGHTFRGFKLVFLVLSWCEIFMINMWIYDRLS